MFARLLLLFILIPLIDFGIIYFLWDKIGIWETIAIIIFTGILGAAHTKAQGAKALSSFQKALATGKMPHKEVVDGLLILVAGAVLLTPGFLTDAIGFLLLFPPARAVIRKVLTDKLSKRVQVSVGGNPLDPNFEPPLEDESTQAKQVSGKVIDV